MLIYFIVEHQLPLNIETLCTCKLQQHSSCFDINGSPIFNQLYFIKGVEILFWKIEV
jgi:hypothetical protein